MPWCIAALGRAHRCGPEGKHKCVAGGRAGFVPQKLQMPLYENKALACTRKTFLVDPTGRRHHALQKLVSPGIHLCPPLLQNNAESAAETPLADRSQISAGLPQLGSPVARITPTPIGNRSHLLLQPDTPRPGGLLQLCRQFSKWQCQN